MQVPAPLRKAALRTKTVVPADLRRLARALRSLRGSGPVIGLPSFRRALVVAPHPDDEVLGCGGTVALLTQKGASVTIITATDGEATKGVPDRPEEIARRRRAEAERSAAALAATPRFLGLADGSLSEQRQELTTALRAAIGELDPEVVFAPWPLDATSDHGAVADAVAAAITDAEGPEVWGYEVWTALVPNRLVDITPVIERRRAALAAHETASQALDLSAGEGLARWRSLHGLGGRGWVEAFLALPAAQYRSLVGDLRNGA